MTRRQSLQSGLVGALLCMVALLVSARMAEPAAAGPESPAPEQHFQMQHWPPRPAASRGRAVYEKRCIGCHGEAGRGDGEAARWLDPVPRNFQKGNFKFRTTPSGELPTEDDLLHVVACGLKGSSMPAFPLMPESQRRDVVAYVLYLARFGLLATEVEDMLADGDSLEDVLAELPEIEAEVMADAFEEVWPVSVESPPEADEDSVARGRALYEAQCVACHGAGGRGDGPSSFSLRDWKDASVRPRDFTTGVFRAGSAPRDLFLRMRTGLNGTPMPSVYGSDEDLWSITHYILSLQDESTRVAPHPVSCEAHAAER